ncbi:hypothetical protein VTN49DRAFT_3932 [Thermomyces lanuginosus]|uniref:uncharacterized protein n=1 Tax=Thermomyces lanuginosus TaxID=5541 RepID=UPI0037441BDF
MAHETPADSAGPSSPPPPLPEGWLAQWEGVSRRWYFVQRVTGKTQWEVPTEPAPLSPSTTPASIGSGPTWPPVSGPQTSSVPQHQSTGDTLRGLFSSATEKAGLSNFQNFLSNSQRNPQLGGLTQVAAGMLNKLSNQFLHDKPSQHGSHASATNLPPVSTGLSSHFHSPPSQPPYGYPGQPGPYPASGPQYRPPESAPFSPISPTSHYPGPAGYNQHPISSPTGAPQTPWQQGPPPAVPPTTQPTSSYQSPGSAGTPVQQHYGQTFPPPPPYTPHGAAPHGAYPQGNFPPPPPPPHPAQHMNSYGPGPGQPVTQSPSSQAPQDPSTPGPYSNPPPGQPGAFHPGAYHAGQPHYPYTPGQPTPPAYPPGPTPSSAPQQPSHPGQSAHPTTTSQSSSHAFIAELPDTSISVDKLSTQSSTTSPAQENVTATPQTQTPNQQQQPAPFVSELPGNEPPRASQTDPQFVGGPFRATPDGRQEFAQSSSNP